MSTPMEGKRALVTAAAQGIGEAAVRAFQAEGAEVVVTDVAAGKLAALSGLSGVSTRHLEVTDGVEVEAPLAAFLRPQRPFHVPDDPGGASGNARGGRRVDRQRVVRRLEREGRAGPLRLRDHQGGGRGSHQGGGGGLRRPGPSLQRHLPRHGADAVAATLVGRAHRPDLGGPSVVAISEGRVVDITSREAPTVRDLCEIEDPVAYVRAAAAVGEDIGSVEDLATASEEATRTGDRPWLLAPVDLQAIKAAGVTFALSLLERVIEEQARGAPERAAAIRAEVNALVGEDLATLVLGSEAAAALKAMLTQRGAWSQYLEVGIGPDAEIFTKAQPLSAVGPGAFVGIHPGSAWNNPEPEVALVIDGRGRTVGATLANDVNLRDFEGRSALLLGKAKDNNASCAIGPLLRLFDAGYGPGEVRATDVRLRVEGEDGFRLEATSSMDQISRDPQALVAATIDENHQYPDGLVLLLGTRFAPVQDRGEPGSGFTHHAGDVVTIETETLGALRNTVRRSDTCAPWTFGAAALMRNLAARGLL